jgi:hypothetical protein
MIGIIGLVGWMAMVGWVAKTSQAQNGAEASVSPPLANFKNESVSTAPQPPHKRSGGEQGLAPVAPDTVPPVIDQYSPALSQSPAHPLEPIGTTSPPPAKSDTSALQPASSPSEPASSNAAQSHSTTFLDDPEQAAQSFVERNQKEAEDHLHALVAEAQQLRARLAKLESGIRKWQGLANALKSSQEQPSASMTSTSGADDAGDLEPIKPARASGSRADKRVKWANASSAAAGAGAQPGEHSEPAQQQPARQPQPLQVTVPGFVPR